MAASIGDFLNKFTKMEKIHKIIILSGVGFMLLFTILIISFSNSKKYVPIYYNLPESQSGEVVEFLKKQHILYKINSSSGLIEVPNESVYEARMQLARSGLPASKNIGLEIFDKTKLGQTEFVQNVNYIRAIQGELSRSIESIRGVKSARVHIVIPKDSLFSQEQLPATASVIIDYSAAEGKMNKNQIQGIVNLVANSVEGLKVENVKIIDSFGNIISDILKDDSEDVTGEVNKKLDYKKKMESYYEKRVQSMLEQVVGKGKVIARVTVDIDFTKSEKIMEFYDPENIAERSHQKTKDTAVEYDATKGGVPGVASNVPSVMADQNSKLVNENLKKNMNKEQEIVNYEVSKTVDKIVNATGVLKRVSVAVVVDGIYKEVKKDKKVIKEFSQRTPQEMDTFREIVKKAIGFNETRKDQVEVSCVAFSYNELDEITDKIQQDRKNEIIMTAVKYGLTTLLLLIIFIFIFRPFLKIILERVKPPAELIRKPKTIESLEKEIKAKGGQVGQGGVSAGGKVSGEEGLEAKGPSPREILVRLIEQNPKEVSKLVQQWVRSR